MSYHLQQRKIAQANIVKVYFQIFPTSNILAQSQAFIFSCNFCCKERLICASVDTRPELSRK